MQNTGLVVDGTEVRDFGINFGVGIPLGGYGIDRFSNLNVSATYGTLGGDNGLTEENYFLLNIGLSLNSKWFQKRVID